MSHFVQRTGMSRGKWLWGIAMEEKLIKEIFIQTFNQILRMLFLAK